MNILKLANGKFSKNLLLSISGKWCSRLPWVPVGPEIMHNTKVVVPRIGFLFHQADTHASIRKVVFANLVHHYMLVTISIT